MHIWKLFDLKGKIALVTGGAGRYGAYIAEGLGEAGATVIIASRNLDVCQNKAEQLLSGGLDIRALEVDIADEGSVKALREKILSDSGKIDILVNNAVGRASDLAQTVPQIWAESMKINAVGLCICCNIFLEAMIPQGSGNIINISSMYGTVGQDPHMYNETSMISDFSGDYMFHKGGMINYTRYLAARYGGYNIRVNCISPGGMFANQPEEYLEKYYSRVPLGRMAKGDDIKGAVVYLSSDASAYVTGQNLHVDGGWTIW